MKPLRIGLFLVLWCTALVAIGQPSVGVKADVGVGWLQREPALSSEWETRLGWGPQLGGYARYAFKRQWFAEAQLTFNHFATRRRYPWVAINGLGMPTGDTVMNYASENISQLSLPVYGGYNLGWCALMVGAQANLAMGSSARSWATGTINGVEYSYDNRVKGLAIRRSSIGLKIGVIAGLSRRFSLEASYYHGLTDIHKVPDGLEAWHMRQVTYGLRYTILSSSRY